jgi:hypothetical protein
MVRALRDDLLGFRTMATAARRRGRSDAVEGDPTAGVAGAA